MSITLNKDEFRDFMGKLGYWFAERDKYVLDHFTTYSGGPEPAKNHDKTVEHFIKSRQEFEKKKPRPDWRQLL